MTQAFYHRAQHEKRGALGFSLDEILYIEYVMDQFMRNCARGESKDACWRWTGPAYNGKPKVNLTFINGSRHVSVARLAYVLRNGIIDSKRRVTHAFKTCDNLCVRPDHQKLQRQNTYYWRTIKPRQVAQRRMSPSNLLAPPLLGLSAEAITQIRFFCQLDSTLRTRKMVSREYDLTDDQLSFILNGQNVIDGHIEERGTTLISAVS